MEDIDITEYKRLLDDDIAEKEFHKSSKRRTRRSQMQRKRQRRGRLREVEGVGEYRPNEKTKSRTRVTDNKEEGTTLD